ncbi:MAG: DUF429 domain-containing protein [bacterium]
MNTTKKFPYWGVDGCKSGWFCVGINKTGDHRHFVEGHIKNVVSKVMELGGKTILIDIPIGLPSDAEERDCDKQARKRIGNKRGPAVFRVPCLQAIEVFDEAGVEVAKQKNCEITGLKLSNQTWAIAPKISEVNRYLKENKKCHGVLREVHPEVCFRMLSEAELEHNKKKREGFQERQRILNQTLSKNPFDEIRNKYLKKAVADDDINDALVAAVTALLGAHTGLKTLPKSPPKDENGLPMEMVYFEGK